MATEKNQYEQSELELDYLSSNASSNYKIVWQDELRLKIWYLMENINFSDSTVFFHILSWYEVWKMKALFMLDAKIQFLEKRKDADSLYKLALLNEVISILRDPCEKDKEREEELFLEFDSHFGTHFKMMVLSILAFDSLMYGGIKRYYESDLDDLFKENFDNDFPIYEPWRWKQAGHGGTFLKVADRYKDTMHLHSIINELTQKIEDRESAIARLESQVSLIENQDGCNDETSSLQALVLTLEKKIDAHVARISFLENELSIRNIKYPFMGSVFFAISYNKNYLSILALAAGILIGVLLF